MESFIKLGNDFYVAKSTYGVHMARSEFLGSQVEGAQLVTDSSFNADTRYPVVIHFFPFNALDPKKVAERVVSLDEAMSWLAQDGGLKGTNVD